MTQKHIAVVGGGPAGLMAAIRAAESGARVSIYEKMGQPGRKLCITGKGRCNITNVAKFPYFIDHFGKNGNFLRQAFSRFFVKDLMNMLESSGLRLVTERGGRVFPTSGKAPDVLKALQSKAFSAGVKIHTISPVKELLTDGNRINGIATDKEKIECDAVILATGGASYPATGSTGDGYKLAEALGHSIVPIRPALVPLETEGDTAGRMADLNLRNINVTMFVNGKKRMEEFGELVFTEFGVTGPVILTLSGHAVDSLIAKAEVGISIDLKPALNRKKLDARLVRDFAKRGGETMYSILRGLLPREMIPVCLEMTDIPRKRQGGRITAEERKRLLYWLRGFRLKIIGYRPFEEAIITAGGIALKEIDPRTMESRLVKDLFLAGEVLDLNADTGGYNLQAAFSTGWLAGNSASE